MTCPHCKGTGTNEAEYGRVKCPDCGGKGEIICEVCAAVLYQASERINCPSCDKLKGCIYCTVSSGPCWDCQKERDNYEKNPN